VQNFLLQARKDVEIFRCAVAKVKIHGSLKSPLCSSVSITALQLSIRVVERNDSLDVPRWTENANLARAKARAILRVIDGLIFR